MPVSRRFLVALHEPEADRDRQHEREHAEDQDPGGDQRAVAARRWLDKLREHTDKPVRYLVLSHYHAVRVLGASAFGWLAPGELRLFEASEREAALTELTRAELELAWGERSSARARLIAATVRFEEMSMPWHRAECERLLRLCG